MCDSKPSEFSNYGHHHVCVNVGHFGPDISATDVLRKAGVSVRGVDPKHVFMHTYVMHFLGLKV